MQNASRFLLDDSHAGVGRADAPSVFRLRQQFPRPTEPDLVAAVRREMAPAVAVVTPGQRIAVTGSSRGIANLALVVRECVGALRDAGADPFVVPAMGSHGGATADGQTRVLDHTNGITEASVGCPIESSMDVVQIGTTDSGFPVYQDRLCHEADGVLVVNRVKPHTGFTERVESGICKMLVIGMGKQAGASKIHHQALRLGMGRLVLEAAPHDRGFRPGRGWSAPSRSWRTRSRKLPSSRACRSRALTRSSRPKARCSNGPIRCCPGFPSRILTASSSTRWGRT